MSNESHPGNNESPEFQTGAGPISGENPSSQFENGEGGSAYAKLQRAIRIMKDKMTGRTEESNSPVTPPVRQIFHQESRIPDAPLTQRPPVRQIFGSEPRMPQTPPSHESSEKKEHAKIVLRFSRHDEKGKGADDTEVRLTEQGRLHAAGLSRDGVDLTNTVAFGSPRKRTQETAGLIMAGGQEGVLGTESLEDLKNIVNKDIGFGSKITQDKRLDFIMPPKGPYLDEMMVAFKEGRLLKYLVEESDAKAKQMGGGRDLMSYSSQASKIAEIVAKYLKIMPRWEKIVNDDEKDVAPVMERILASHQSVTESFLAKVIEMTKGVDERDAFVESLGDQGFGFAEGFKIEIEKDDKGEDQLRISFKKEKDGEVIFDFDEVVSKKLIKRMIMPPGPKVPYAAKEKKADKPKAEKPAESAPKKEAVKQLEPSEKVPAGALSSENERLFRKLAEPKKGFFRKLYDSALRFTGADVYFAKMEAAHQQSLADMNEKKAVGFKEEMSRIDLKNEALDTAKKELESAISALKDSNSPGVENLLLKVREIDIKKAELMNERDIAQTQFEAFDAKKKLFINERDKVADKLIGSYNEFLAPMEGDLEKLQTLKDQLDLDVFTTGVRHEEKLTQLNALEKRKSTVEAALKLAGDADDEIKKTTQVLEDMLQQGLAEIKKEKEELAKRKIEIDKKVAAVDELANPYRDRREQFVRIKAGRPIEMNVKARKETPVFSGSEIVTPGTRIEGTGNVEVKKESKIEAKNSTPETGEKDPERRKISDFITEWNAFIIKKGTAKDSVEVINAKDLLSVSKMSANLVMNFDNFKAILEKYYKFKKIPVEKFSDKVSSFYFNKIKVKN